MAFKLNINTGISDKDKKLIVIALTILILLGGWQFFLKPKYNKINDFKKEVNNNSETRDDLQSKYIKLREFKKELKLNKYKINNLQSIIPEYLYTEDVLVALNEMGKSSKVISKGTITVTEPTSYQAEGTSAVAAGFYKRDINMDIEGKYKDILDFLKLITSSRLNMIIHNADISTGDGGKMDASIALSIYTYNPTGRLPEIMNEGGVLPQGDFTVAINSKRPGTKEPKNPERAYNNVIGYGTTKATVDKEPDTKGKIDISKLNIDFYCIINPFKDDAPSVTMGKYPLGYTEVSSDYNEDSEVLLSIHKIGGKYYYSYSIDGTKSYPESGEQEFMPSSKKLVFNIISSFRTDSGDKSGMKLRIENDSDLELLIKVANDDKESPRVKVEKSTGKYSVVNQ